MQRSSWPLSHPPSPHHTGPPHHTVRAILPHRGIAVLRVSSGAVGSASRAAAAPEVWPETAPYNQSNAGATPTLAAHALSTPLPPDTHASTGTLSETRKTRSIAAAPAHPTTQLFRTFLTPRWPHPGTTVRKPVSDAWLCTGQTAVPGCIHEVRPMPYIRNSTPRDCIILPDTLAPIFSSTLTLHSARPHSIPQATTSTPR
jgi:hypothetical protein